MRFLRPRLKNRNLVVISLIICLVLIFNGTVFKREPSSHRKHPQEPSLINWFGSEKNVSSERPVLGYKSYESQCDWISESREGLSKLDMTKLVEKLPFDNPPGGAWTQGFDISYETKQWSPDKKLHVIIVPHSHNDPGWLMTYEEYFEQKTKNILDTIAESLSEKPTRKFVWAETSYFYLWWKQASPGMREKMRKLIVETKQLEIVTGGWVMTDEANTHYYSTIEQMIEGHEWLKANVDKSINPKYGWSIDPFGHSSTMPYILKQMGFEGMLIQRIHYHFKKHLALTNDLEILWRQQWSPGSSKDTSILCHIMPFYSYGINHACGPDPNVCCRFDYKALDPGAGGGGCNPRKVTDENVKDQADQLLDQYRKKSQLYGGDNNHNVVLVPLGNDFTYVSMTEAHNEFENYERLIEYMNKNYDVDVRFGTLKDYFELLQEKNKQYKNEQIKTFSGDFFTYSDKDTRYWSGYFTSRPFFKRLDRITEHYLRSAEITLSLSNLIEHKQGREINNLNSLYKKLLSARRNLGVFQHHDGITGTARHLVVMDYAKKLYEALEFCREIIESSVSRLMASKPSDHIVFSLSDDRTKPKGVINEKSSELHVLDDTNSEIKIAIFNPNLNKRLETIGLKLNTKDVEVIDSKGNKLKQVQVSLVWPTMQDAFDNLANNSTAPFAALTDSYEILFEVAVESLSVQVFTIRKTQRSSQKINKVTLYYTKRSSDEAIKKMIDESAKTKQPIEYIQASPSDPSQTNPSNTISLPTGTDYEAVFSLNTGCLLKLHVPRKDTINVSLGLLSYGTGRTGHDWSGAYLFVPNGPGKPLNLSESHIWTRVESGPLRSRVCVHMTKVIHCAEIYPRDNQRKSLIVPSIQLWNLVDLRQVVNFEVALSIKTSIHNKDEFFTDLNGYQYVKRKRYEKLSLGGNVYPMPAGAFIQDESYRLNLLTAQSLGVTSPESGELQVFLDRHLNQDDNLGLGEPMTDNIVVSNRLLILFEPINSKAPADNTSKTFPSLLSTWTSNDLMYPLVRLAHTKQDESIHMERKFAKKEYPCDLHLINMRSMHDTDQEEPFKNEIGLILHRTVYHEECPTSSPVKISEFIQQECKSREPFSFNDLFDFIDTSDLSISHTLLNLAKNDSNTRPTSDDTILRYIQPMQIEAFRVRV